jgi:hypothetical protein
MPTSPSQEIHSNSSTNNRLLMGGQAQDLFSHRPPPTLLTSVNGPILSKQRRQHTINLLLLLQDHNHSPPVRKDSGVMVSQLPLRSVQAGMSHTRQSSNSAQLFLLPSSVHQTTIAMTLMSLRPGLHLGMMQIPTPIARVYLHRRTST